VFSISTLEGTQSLAPGGLPQGYRVKSFTYGNVDVTAGPLNIAVTDTAELRLVLESARPVRVRGLVVDLEKLGIASESLRVALRSPNFVDGPEAVVGKDGRFEFPEVMPGMYTPTFQGFKAPQTRELLIVDGEDIDSLEVEAPDRKEVEGRVMIQGDAPVPRFKLVWRRFDKWAAEIEEAAQKSGIQISLGPDWSSDTLDIDPQPDGTFKLSLFEGVYEIWILLPAGYKLAVDESRMTVRHAGPTVLRVQVETWGRPVNVIGHVDGLDRASFALPDATVSLTTSRHAVVSTSTLDKNGAFAFPNVFPGTYALRLNAPGLPNDICAPVTVKEDDPTNAAIAVPLPGVHQDSLQIISAIFGNRQGAADVTPMARKMIKPELAEIYATPAWLEVDPAAFTHKELTVSYLFRCADYTFTTREAGAVSYAMLVQNADPSRRAPATGNGDFRVLSAYYTAGSHYDNITPRIQELATPNRDPFDVAVATQGSLTFKPRGRSYLIVTYLLEGRRATLAVNPYLAPKLSYEWLAAFAKYSSGVGAVVPNWLAEAQPYSPREPGDPGPGFGKEPEREIGIAALLKAHAELKALAPEDSTSKVAHAISAIERALALAQTNYVYPSPGAKPILIAVPKATWKQRFDYARDALSEALGVLEAANTLSDTQSLTMKIEDEIDQALIDLDEAENGLTEIRGASSVPNSPLCVLCVSVVNFP
jgi:hypothetical protein